MPASVLDATALPEKENSEILVHAPITPREPEKE